MARQVALNDLTRLAVTRACSSNGGAPKVPLSPHSSDKILQSTDLKKENTVRTSILNIRDLSLISVW